METHLAAGNFKHFFENQIVEQEITVIQPLKLGAIPPFIVQKLPLVESFCNKRLKYLSLSGNYQ